MLIPRPYQEEAVGKAFWEWDRGSRSTIIVLPTGTGKTIVFALAGQRVQGKVIVLAHRQELIFQAADKIKMVTGETPEIEMGDQWADLDGGRMWEPARWVVGSVQTVHKPKRLARIKWPEFDMLIIDEGHHARAKSYRTIIDEAVRQNPKIKILLVSATPKRSDGKALGAVVDSVAYELPIWDAIQDGWLVPIRQKFGRIGELDLSGIDIRNGDFDNEQLAAAMTDDGGPITHKIACAMIDGAGQEKSVIFTSCVRQAYQVAEVMNRHYGSERAVAMDGTWEKDKREAVLRSFARGEFQHLLNHSLFMEGWDEPTVSVVGLARPTKSLQVYTQKIGRALRPLPGLVDGQGCSADRRARIASSNKPRALAIDIVGNSGRHKLISAADLLGGDYSDEVRKRASNKAEKESEKGKESEVAELLEEEKQKLANELERARKRRESRKRVLIAKAKVSWEEISPFETDSGQTSGIINKRDVAGEVATDQQMAFLEKQGVDAIGMTKGEAGRLIGEIKQRWKNGLCSLKQSRRLAMCGFSGTENMKSSDAGDLLTLVSSNGWRAVSNLSPARFKIIQNQNGGYSLALANDQGLRQAVGKPLGSPEEVRAYGHRLLYLHSAHRRQSD